MVAVEPTQVQVTFLPSGTRLKLVSGSPVGPQLKRTGVSVRSSCEGVGYCADCIVVVIDGVEFTNTPTYNVRGKARPRRLSASPRLPGSATD